MEPSSADPQHARSGGERARSAATVRFEPTEPSCEDARRAMERYFAELDERFPGGFHPGDAYDTDRVAFTPPAGLLLLATSDGAMVGCGGLQHIDDTTTEIKRMWIDPAWRGLGLGRRLLTTLEALATELGFHRAVLDTNTTLVEAIAMYESAGFEAAERYNDNPYAKRWFCKDLRSPNT